MTRRSPWVRDSATLDVRDRQLLKSATRRIAIQTAAVLAVVVTLAVVGLAVAFDRAQHAQIERTVRSAARTADDVGDPPPGVLLVESRDGSVVLTPGAPSYLRSLASSPKGKGSADLEGHAFLTYTAVRDGRTFVAAYDLASHHDEEMRLLWASVIAGLLGIVLATAAGSIIGRRSVRPMASCTRGRSWSGVGWRPRPIPNSCATWTSSSRTRHRWARSSPICCSRLSCRTTRSVAKRWT